jgi:hypothetical protein
MTPIFEQAATQLEPDVRLIKVDSDAVPKLLQRYSIQNMVWLDGGVSDEVRFAAVADIAGRLQPKVIIGLFLNPLPLPGPVEEDATTGLIEHAREAGDEIEKVLTRRLQMLERPVEIRRFDVLEYDIAKIAAREARSADTFVTPRPNGAMDPDQLVEGFCSDRAGTCS